MEVPLQKDILIYYLQREEQSNNLKRTFHPLNVVKIVAIWVDKQKVTLILRKLFRYFLQVEGYLTPGFHLR